MRAARRLPAGVIAALVLGAGAGACSRTPLAVPEPAGDGGPGEVCNGIDDDGDGRVDEDLPPQRCGVGACEVEVPGCEGGRVPACVPGAPTEEVCNGVDDDCDGAVDDGLPVGPVGEATVVRDDEGRTGGCSSCVWAFGAALRADDEGVVVAWRLGFDGLAPQPNVFHRPLDAGGAPTGPVGVLFERNVTRGLRFAASGGGALAFCGRVGADDVAAGALVGRDGAVDVPPTNLVPAGFSCGAGDPDVARVGDRWLFAWTDNRSGEFEILVGTTDLALGGREGRVLVAAGGDPSVQPRVAVAGDRALIASGFRGDDGTSLVLHLLDGRGEVLAGPTFVAVPGGGRWTRTVALADDAGFLVLGADRGLYGVRVARTGALVAPPRALDDGTWSSLAGVARADGGFLLAGDRRGPGETVARPTLRVVEGDGEARVSRAAPEVEGWGQPALARGGGRTWIAWIEPAGGGANRVLAQRLGCVDR